MKIVLFSRPNVEYKNSELELLGSALSQVGIDFCMDDDFALKMEAATGGKIPLQNRCRRVEDIPVDASMVVSFGGDGTFLDAVRTLQKTGLPFLGINSGRLGFLANVPLEGMLKAFDDIKNNRFHVEQSSLLHTQNINGEASCEYPFAFNEFSVQRRGTSMISVETYVDDEMVATYWGDGVLLSTPAGSTAYSLSVGGPVIAPQCRCFVISPIAPHNLTMRPVIVPDTSVVTFKVSTRDKSAFATFDNINCVVGDGARFAVSRSESSVFLVRLQNISFYDTLRNKMLWGIDRRDLLDVDI